METISINNYSYNYDNITGYLSLKANTQDLNEELEKPNDYEQKKYEYLQKFNLISKKSDKLTKILTKKDIEDAISNTHQIIFEVTDRCNLNCFYCGYGHFYNNYDKRENKNLNFERFLTTYNFFKNLWHQTSYKGSSYLRISFYGGEPLCNFKFIQQVVKFIKRNPLPNKIITYSITTNAVLLHKYMDFLVENDFDILISLDGNKTNNSYRVFHNKLESFDTVIHNLDILRKRFPDFFSKRIKFNSVLHNKNSVVEATSFIFSKYNKKPMTNELNVFGIAEERIEEFRSIFHSKGKEFKEMTSQQQRELSNENPFLHHYEKWIFQTCMNTYSNDIHNVLFNNYSNDLISKIRQLPTNTCIPFSRKFFVSVSGKIYPCERIGNEINFGKITESGIYINFEEIVSYYNRLLNRYVPLCSKCKTRDYCSVCIVSNFDGVRECKQLKPRNIGEIIDYFSNHPEHLRRMIKSLIVL